MDNPFQSPETASPAIVEDDGVNRPHFLMRLFYGWLFGGLFGLFFGSAGALLLGVVLVVAYYRGESEKLPFEGFAFLGAICGGLSGGIIGPLAILIAILSPRRLRRFIPLLTSGFAGIAGLLFGMLGGVSPVRFDEFSKLEVAVGGLLGLGAGIIGGWLLGRFLRRWNS